VWTTCQLFFQGVLLAGYGYAHWVGQISSPRTQRRVHLTLLSLGIAAVVVVVALGGQPILAPEHFKPTGNENPVLLLLATLALTTALPFVGTGEKGQPAKRVKPCLL